MLDLKSDYRSAIRRVDYLIDAGNSFSGNEPNCAFLNLGDGTFATASAVSGFDFPDDARALALTDWDGDGDQDVWMTCRTAPMLRFLRNDTPRAGPSLLLRLEGTKAARDAAGARAEVRLKALPDKPIIRTVKFGEGFLGQSSRWLHFGLGTQPDIASVRITWPGGTTEEIKDCRPGTAISFVEGASFPQTVSLKDAAPATAPAPLKTRKTDLAGAVTLFHPVLFPPLPAGGTGGRPWTVTDSSGPLLVNVFASWCPDCAAELTAWRDSADKIKAAGLNIALLSADGRETQYDTTPADAFAWLKEKRIPFPAGVLTDEAFRRLNTAHRRLFGAIVSLPVPCSFLLDGKGRLAAVYRGPVSLERVLSDTAAAVADDAAVRSAAALPWSGRWMQDPDTPDPTFWLNELVLQQSWDEAAAFFRQHRATLRPHKDFVTMAGALGGKLAPALPAAAVAAYEAALEKAPDSAAVLNNLAGLLVTTRDPAVRNPVRALALAQRAVTLTAGKSAAMLDTLAAAHAAAGDFKSAAATEARAIEAARAGETGLLPLLEKALRSYQTGKPAD
ncbi:MAG: ASPIC/UnbV domain-containing protein [Verrucomicrobiales bacterium]|nr:ASPIC/UnbV domain-containing protein [Verrucomicrobiales bacterium]